ncbi:D-alanyl-D-alanine carboxypeptidase/D-alanyl-D-alanine-endopeptidase [Paraflavitalea pollutisoli]|uniref:D-alanyl-D-alanine carboxypeptidase/D-alanyl-D-alanine endopeptidase n=1 Tax=Paraflavitalea pollutisoli TaxID=3034143 RepID=UPI0023EC7E7D|nr:D-alanyl-D-alanine carboxypeptidase/D-alanyl-D-alanine-endopeptidase [Paraflavitalea sp. H1-2-19X]
MKYILLFLGSILLFTPSKGQALSQQLATAVRQLEATPAMKYAIFSLYVADAKTGKPVYAHNNNIGLAPASTQKLFTSTAAFELLGPSFRYTMQLRHDGEIGAGRLKGNLYVVGSGDPTLGSWRWKETKDSVVLKQLLADCRRLGITRGIDGAIIPYSVGFSHQGIPDGWIWQDIGNYYGAGAYGINWQENQYDLHLRSGATVNDPVSILEDSDPNSQYINELKSAAKGSGDNAYIYLSPVPGKMPLVAGTIPVNERSFAISGALADPAMALTKAFSAVLAGGGIDNSGQVDIVPVNTSSPDNWHTVSSISSPPLDSINYWFLRRSINLYGEALVKTMAAQQGAPAATDRGIELLRNFWQARGIDKAAIHLLDGSGLSPQNRVTTTSLVQVLQYAKTRPWYSSFYHCLPEYNGMKMKSGSIGGARAFAGYHTARDGKEYSFAIIANNYDGSSGEMVKAMYQVLNLLK